MRFLFLGDIVGKSGRQIVLERLPNLIKKWNLDFVVVNGENAAGGFGITQAIYEELLEHGVDVVTTGNHVFDQKETLHFAPHSERLLRPANYPAGTPGNGSGLFITKSGARVLIACILGRIFMHPDLNDPFEAAAHIIAACPLQEQADAIIIDFHAEATSEKQCFGHFLDGRVSVVVGTHTHIPTADAQILNYGTAYMTDAGMCGDYDSSLGMNKEEPLNRFLTKIPRGRFEVAQGPATLCGLAVEICNKTGLAHKVSPVRIGARLKTELPDFW
ncbi:TIGR00282 family metallophosphoesterase [Bartonella sp. DGB2]|uniref:TIGR00282 family metallophosphoesterase n=1 Tax=Bartonella sp. DGB2 TaxID=3388426 RepID=UPI00398FAD4B